MKFLAYFLILLILHCKVFAICTDSIPNIELGNYLFKKTVQLSSPHSSLTLPLLGDVHFGNNSTHQNYLLTSYISTRYFFGNATFSRVLADVHLDAEIRILRNNSYSQKYQSKIPWDNSMPVRTPTIKPGVTLYYNLFNESRREYAMTEFLNSNAITKVLKGRSLSLKVFHHSNGQDGKHASKYLNDLVKLRNGADIDTLVFNSPFNVYNGNFAVDIIIEPGITFTTNTFNTTYNEKYRAITTLYLGYESGSLGVNGPFGEQKLNCFYGLEKIKIRWNRIRIDKLNDEAGSFEKNRIRLDASLALNKIKDANLFTRLNTELTFQFNPRRKNTPYFKNNNLSFFVSGGWKGQDDYNIYFQDSFVYLKTGLAMGFKADNSNKMLKAETAIQ